MKCVVYKIFNKMIDDYYIGSTINFHRRRSEHKCDCNNENSERHYIKLYKFIRNNGGFADWHFEILFLFDNKESMIAKEIKLIRELKPTLNTNVEYRNDEELKEYNKAYGVLYKPTPETKAKQKAYKSTPEYRAKQKTYRATPERKAKQKAHEASPERKEYIKAYNDTPERKEYMKAYNATPETKDKQKAYRASPEQQAKQKAYRASPEQQAKQKAYNETPERKALKKALNKAYYERRKLEKQNQI